MAREYRCWRPSHGCGGVYIDQRALDAAVGALAVEILSDPRHAGQVAAAAGRHREDAARLDAAIAEAEKLELALADRLGHPADKVSPALNLCVLGLIVVIRFPMLAAIRLAAFMGVLALVAASIGTGWLLGEAGSENRKAMTFTTSVRNVRWPL